MLIASEYSLSAIKPTTIYTQYFCRNVFSGTGGSTCPCGLRGGGAFNSGLFIDSDGNRADQKKDGLQRGDMGSADDYGRIQFVNVLGKNMQRREIQIARFGCLRFRTCAVVGHGRDEVV